MRQTGLTVDAQTGHVELGVRVDTREQDYLNALERKANPSGFTKGRSLRAVAEIPFDFLQSLALIGDKDGSTLFNVESSPMEKKRALRSLLFKYPEFRLSEGRL
jgi:hypothetical protein